MNDYDPPLTNCPFCVSDMLVFFDEDFRGNRISRCLDCQVKFMNPRYSDEYLCDFYSKYTTIGKSQEELDLLWKEALTAGHNFYLSLVERYVPAGKMLSVGCGSGVELEAARSRNWKVEGYDVDEATVARLRDKLGIKISSGDFLDSGYQSGTYECCYLHHVLEHLKNPQDYLGKIQSILKPGGVLFIACPNVVSLSNSFKTFLGKVNLKKNRGKHYDTNHHLFYFSPWVLKRILERFFAFSVLLIKNGHHVRPSQSRLKRFLMRNFTEIFPWKSSFILIARKK